MKITCFLASLAVSLGAAAQTGTAPSTAQTDSLKLDSLVRALPEHVVKGHRPVVRTEPGKLVFDMNALLKDRPADNIYDALKELPGVVEQNGTLTLNTQSVSLIIDGKVSSLTTEQLTELLKTMPKSRLAKCEIMMSTPARYKVRGAAINIVLRHGTGFDGLSGELYGSYEQKHFAVFEERAAVLYNSGKFELDALYSHRHGNKLDECESDYLHTLDDGSVTPFSTYEWVKSNGHHHDMRLGMTWNFSKNNSLSFVYTGNYKTTSMRDVTSGSINSAGLKNRKPWLHNLKLDYQAPWGMTMGAEMTYYESPATEFLDSRLGGEQLDFQTDNRQKINSWNVYAAQEHALAHGWGLNYGATVNTSLDNSWQTYRMLDTNTAVLPVNSSSRRRETMVNVYAGMTKNFGRKLSLDYSLAAEYNNTTTWNGWDLFPNVNLTYMPAQGHTLIFGLNSDKAYPSYWSVQDFTSYVDGGYALVVGNPKLKPSCAYRATLTYVLHNKYMVTAFFSYNKNHFTQLGYQRPDTLQVEYKFLNEAFSRKAGLQIALPFSVSRWLNMRFTFGGVYDKVRNSHFYDIPYSRDRFFFVGMFNGSVVLARPLVLMLDGSMQTKALQGVYDVKTLGSLNAALRLTLLKDKLLMKVWCNDLLHTDRRAFTDTWKGQNISVDNYYYREFGLSLTYKFNGYKERKHTAVDTNRFK